MVREVQMPRVEAVKGRDISLDQLLLLIVQLIQVWG